MKHQFVCMYVCVNLEKKTVPKAGQKAEPLSDQRVISTNSINVQSQVDSRLIKDRDGRGPVNKTTDPGCSFNQQK